MLSLFFNGRKIATKEWKNLAEVTAYIKSKTILRSDEFYLEQGGKKCTDSDSVFDSKNGNIHCVLRIRGGKGGFGSMLRAIGAQIEKTTNREACRDLSGRRLRDINEEKRLKAWLEKQEERELEEEERKKRKIEKLLAVPKHKFEDPLYEDARTKVSEKINDAFEAGLKKSLEAASTSEYSAKRKGKDNPKNDSKAKRKKNKLWLDEDLSSDTDKDDENETQEKTKSN